MKPKKTNKPSKKKDEIFVEPEPVLEDVAEGSDVEPENEEHDSLVKNLLKNSKLNADFKWKSKRTEAATAINEFGITKDESTRVSIHKLLKTSKNVEGKKKLRSFEQKAVTAAPLVTPLAKRVARKANFAEVSTEITKYDPVVKELRNADQVVFPLNQAKVGFNVATQLGTTRRNDVEKPKPVTALEKEIEEQIQVNPSNIELDSRPFTENELAVLKAKSVEEARAIHREIQKRRALISYQEAKYRRMRKIKSKNYHRLLKKEKLKKTVEDFDKLVADDPEKAIEKLEELNKLRALERASLKHHTTGKWAKHQKIRAKYDETARQNMNATLKINADLLRKRSLALLDEFERNSDNESEDENQIDQTEAKIEQEIQEEVQKSLSTSNSYNPWVTQERDRTRRKKAKIEHQELNLDNKAIDDFLRREVERKIREEKEAQRQKLYAADAYDERELEEMDDSGVNRSVFEKEEQPPAPTKDLAEEEGHHFEEFDFHNNEFLREAFIDDDVVEEFYKEKQEQAEREEEERNRKKRKVEVLPGWGHWAGAGIEEDAATVRKRQMKEVRKQKRIDQRITNAIILPDVDAIGSKFKIAHRPAAVGDVKQLEKAVAKPVGSTWNPQSVTRSLTAPSVVLPRGKIIEPMTAIAADKIGL